jgi:hypothetical protein
MDASSVARVYEHWRDYFLGNQFLITSTYVLVSLALIFIVISSSGFSGGCAIPFNLNSLAPPLY